MQFLFLFPSGGSSVCFFPQKNYKAGNKYARCVLNVRVSLANLFCFLRSLNLNDNDSSMFFFSQLLFPVLLIVHIKMQLLIQKANKKNQYSPIRIFLLLLFRMRCDWFLFPR